jgi:pimeloyl-ACP methyl ester carboxylesterase
VIHVARFVRHYLRPLDGRVTALETHYSRGAERVPATVMRPAAAAPDARLPGWVVLHGLTLTGREHPALLRFAAAVAATGRVVLIPEIPEWRALHAAPAVAVPTIRAAVRALHRRPDVDADRTGLFGFSFGATQALIAAADPRVAASLRGVVAWGGYHDLRALFRFGITGHHELDGARYRMPPDPYGAWVMAANYLTAVPGHEDDGDVAAALRALAEDAGARRIYARDPVFDETKARLRAALHARQRATFDLLAPPTTEAQADTDAHFALADGVAAAAARVDPLLEPAAWLPRLALPVAIAHGRDDRLIPFTESIRLGRAVPPAALHDVTITSLFSHSGGAHDGVGRRETAREVVRFVAMLRRVLGLVA